MDIDNEGQTKERSFPIFYPYIKINDGLGYTPANYHVYSLIGYKQAADPDTKRLNYIPIYGLVSKKGYKYRGHTVVEYGKESQFDFNRENVWDYTEALQNQEALADMSDEYSKPNWQNSDIHLITDLPPYQNMNYAKEQQDMKFEWDQDDKDDSEQGVVLSEAEEYPNTNYTNHPVTKIISGGQTGIDRLGLEVGKELGIETGGTTTPGYYTETGRDESLKDFGVTEISPELQQGKRGKEFYLPRTEQNVINSDGTVYFATNEDSAGKIATKRFADKHNKPFLLNPKSGEELRNWLIRNNIKTLNVAGNRGSKIGTLRDTAYKVLTDALKPKSMQLNLFTQEEFDKQIQSDIDAIQQVREYLTELSESDPKLADEINSKTEQFAELLRKENPTTPEEVEGLINKFICNL